MAVALGANLGDPLATLLAVRPLLAAELRSWWMELVLGPDRAPGLGVDQDRGDGAGDGPGPGMGPGTGLGMGLGHRDGYASDGGGECARDGAERSAGPRLRWSPLFRTAPVGGPAGQPDYLNAVVVIDGGPPPSAADRPGLAGAPPGAGRSAIGKAIPQAGVEPSATAALVLLRRLQRLEQRFGRVRSEPWGPRSLDLDLLWCGPQQLDLPELQLPHPRLRQRAFVLTPLAAIDPELTLPAAGDQPAAAVSAMAAAHPRGTDPHEADQEQRQPQRPERRPSSGPPGTEHQRPAPADAKPEHAESLAPGIAPAKTQPWLGGNGETAVVETGNAKAGEAQPAVAEPAQPQAPALEPRAGQPAALMPAEEAQPLLPSSRSATAGLEPEPEPPPQRLAGRQGWPE